MGNEIKKSRAKLCDSQMNIYLECMLAPSSVKYNNTFTVTFTNPRAVSIEEFKTIVDDVIRNHPALYSHIETVDEDVYMVRDEFPTDGICEIKDELDLTIRPFDLSKSPLVRLAICKTNDGFELFFDGHHVVTDGTSIWGFVLHELAAHLSGEPAVEEEVDAFDLYEVEEKLSKTEEFANANKYFEELLAGANMDNTLTPDYTEIPAEIYPIAQYKTELKLGDLKDELESRGLRENTLFLGAFGYSLLKMIGAKDVVIGIGEAGRKVRPMPNTVSMFVKVLPILIAPDENLGGLDYLTKLQSQFHESLKNDIVHLGELYKKVGFSNDSNFIYHGEINSDFEINGVNVRVNLFPIEDAQSKLSVAVEKCNGYYRIFYNYRPDLYGEETIKRLASFTEFSIRNLLTDKPMKEYALISPEEEAVLDSFFGEDADYDKETTFIDRFLENTLKYEDKVALVFKEKTYTYGYLFEIVARMAEYLNKIGIGRGDRVGILTTRGEQMAFLPVGVMLAGASYQPLDPSYPPERLEFMCEDATTDLVITTNKLHALIRGYKGKIILVDDLFDELRKMPNADLKKCTIPRPDDEFVLLYSSGTTGKPKGSKLSYTNLSAFVSAHSKNIGIDNNSIVASYASFSFDAFVGDVFPAFYAGAELHILSDEVRFDFELLKQYLEDHRVTNIMMTTQVASIFTKEYKHIEHLKTVVCGGEKLVGYKPDTNYRLINSYGPSECTVCVTDFPVLEEYEDIPIGFAMQNNHFFVIDSFGRRLPIGAPGELVIAGPQVGMGYNDRPELNEKVFVPNTFETDPKDDFKRAYKTGDIVCFLPNGYVKFVGRRDSQIKIRGFRIELSEVEKVIEDFEKITDATVIAVDGKSGKEIHAYIVAKEQIDVNELNRYIKSRKPSYMVPAAVMQLDAIPMTPNQKVDKKKLPPIVATNNTQIETRSLTKIEIELCEILTEILGEGDFPVNVDFESLGITSITSIRLASAIYKKFGVTISSKDLLSGITILGAENLIIDGLLSLKARQDFDVKKKGLSSYPLTTSQLGIYLECQSGSSMKYNIPMLYRLPKEIDIAELKEAIKSAAKLHPSMLCGVTQNAEGDPVLVSHPDMEINVYSQNEMDFPIEPTEFAFDDSPLFKFRIITYKDNDYLYIEMHHIISDGTSMAIFMSDVDKCYRKETAESEEYTIFDLTLDEKTLRASDEFTKAKEYYKSYFDGVSNDYNICPDKKEDNCLSISDCVLSTSYEKIDKYCSDNKITKNIFFTGAFAILLSKFTAHEDAYFTTIYNGRTDPRTENLISMLVKTIPTYIEIKPEANIAEFFKVFEERLNFLKQNDIYSFADAARDLSLTADTMFIYQGKIGAAPTIGGYELTSIATENDEGKAEIAIEVFDKDDAYSMHVEYNGGKYSEDLINTLINAFDTTIKSVLNSKEINEIEITSEEELARFDNFNDTFVDLQYAPIYRVIEREVEAHPEKIAIFSNPVDVGGICEKESITYRQLNDSANAIAHELIRLGVNPQDNVGILTGRTRHVNMAQFGILKAGAVYLYISPAYPDDRISYIAEESALKALITTRSLYEERKELLDSLGLSIIFAEEIERCDGGSNLDIEAGPEDRAYLIYTSGSTGKPKGVIVTHQGLFNIANANEKNLLIHQYTADVVTSCVAYTFDASIIDGLVALSNGKTICIASDEEIHNIEGFREMCIKYGIEGFCATPALMNSMLDDEKFESVIKNYKSIILGGEVFPKNTFEKLKSINSDLHIINGYGPSEATVGCSASLLSDGDNINIGTPLANYKIYIIDKQKHILPMGSLGELIIVGIGVGDGYINRDDLTEKTFYKMNGERVYKSGDLALISHDEEIVFHGRIDDQVKLRGLRIELGEIESAIGGCPGVVNCAVIVKGEGNNAYLAAYYTAENDITSEEIIEEIKKSLAEYMVPRVVIKLDEIPMTANGKLNKKALKEIKEPERERAKNPPKTELEKTICEVYKSVLNDDEIYRDDNFFEIGGSSLLASKAVMLLKSKNLEVEYQDIFDYQTLAELAEFISSKQGIDNTIKPSSVDTDGTIKAFEQNVLMNVKLAAKESLGNVLLTGATGFLGIHILKELLETEEGHINCFVRSGGFSSPESHLNAFTEYYFDECFLEKYAGRLSLFEANVTDDNLPDVFKDVDIDTIINCAAVVKHFAADDSIERVNVGGVKKLIELAKAKDARLVQISTTSVTGAHTPETKAKGLKMYENQLFCINNMNNKYCIAKFDAEQLMIEAIEQGLRGKIIRVGNLMGRYSDGEFQINMNTNNFLKGLRGFITIGKAPLSNATHSLDFSPVDLTAKVIVLLSGTNDMFTAFNANNRLTFDEAKLFDVCTKCGFPVELTPDDEYYEIYNHMLGDDSVNSRLSGLIASDIKGITIVDVDNTFTAMVLYKLGFSWPFIDDAYLERVIRKLESLGFFM